MMKGEHVGEKDDDNGDDDKVSLENHCGAINELSGDHGRITVPITVQNHGRIASKITGTNHCASTIK